MVVDIADTTTTMSTTTSTSTTTTQTTASTFSATTTTITVQTTSWCDGECQWQHLKAKAKSLGCHPMAGLYCNIDRVLALMGTGGNLSVHGIL